MNFLRLYSALKLYCKKISPKIVTNIKSATTIKITKLTDMLYAQSNPTIPSKIDLHAMAIKNYNASGIL